VVRAGACDRPAARALWEIISYPSPEGGGWLLAKREVGWGNVANVRARQLRKSMTPQEIKLWVRLREWKKRGFHFRRQSPREGYIVDFVCMRERLVVEVDGGQHNESEHKARDDRRDKRLEVQNFKVLRFWNNEIDRNLDGVLEMIDRALQRNRPHPAGFAGHPPPAGEG
jgi:very-short-patch-repair endonuclease